MSDSAQTPGAAQQTSEHDNNSMDTSESFGKGKGKAAAEDMPIDESEEDDDEDGEGEGDIEEPDEDNMEEIDMDNIVGSRTRNKNIDFAKANAELGPKLWLRGTLYSLPHCPLNKSQRISAALPLRLCPRSYGPIASDCQDQMIVRLAKQATILHRYGLANDREHGLTCACADACYIGRGRRSAAARPHAKHLAMLSYRQALLKRRVWTNERALESTQTVARSDEQMRTRKLCFLLPSLLHDRALGPAHGLQAARLNPQTWGSVTRVSRRWDFFSCRAENTRGGGLINVAMHIRMLELGGDPLSISNGQPCSVGWRVPEPDVR
nr:histone h2a.z-specific chaperone chz1 [Quercus suber]